MVDDVVAEQFSQNDAKHHALEEQVHQMKEVKQRLHKH
jgi:hypothetical protein